MDIADALEANESLIKSENEADIAAALEAGKDKALVSRLTLKPGKASIIKLSFFYFFIFYILFCIRICVCHHIS